MDYKKKYLKYKLKYLTAGKLYGGSDFSNERDLSPGRSSPINSRRDRIPLFTQLMQQQDRQRQLMDDLHTQQRDQLTSYLNSDENTPGPSRQFQSNPVLLEQLINSLIHPAVPAVPAVHAVPAVPAHNPAHVPHVPHAAPVPPVPAVVPAVDYSFDEPKQKSELLKANKDHIVNSVVNDLKDLTNERLLTLHNIDFRD